MAERIGSVLVASSPLARRNPSVKLGLLFVVSLALLFVWHPGPPAVLYGVGLVVAVVAARLGWRTLTYGQVPFLLFGAGLWLADIVSRPGRIVWAWGPLSVSAESLQIGGAVFARTLAIGILALSYLGSTDPVDLVESLRQNVRLDVRVAYALLAGYRMLQDLPREWATIRDAQRTPGSGSRRLTPRAAGRTAFGLLVLSIRRAERVSASMETRGLGLRPRTEWRPVRVTMADGVMAAGTLLVVAAVLLLTPAWR